MHQLETKVSRAGSKITYNLSLTFEFLLGDLGITASLIEVVADTTGDSQAQDQRCSAFRHCGRDGYVSTKYWIGLGGRWSEDGYQVTKAKLGLESVKRRELGRRRLSTEMYQVNNEGMIG